jgi:hypothetical protein
MTGRIWQAGLMSLILMGCATQKESHTARTGIEQLLVSSAIDQSLDKVQLEPLKGKQVFVETKYLDCVDKNYIIVSLHHRLLTQNVVLVDKPDNADVILEVGSGAVGTDGQELFVGIPEIPLPPPSPIAIPKLALITRTKMNGTAKLLVVAYDARTKAPLLMPGTSLARSDQNNWNIMGAGPMLSGSVPTEIANATGEVDLTVGNAVHLARRSLESERSPEVVVPSIQTTGHERP